jgi:hypothetical protein
MRVIAKSRGLKRPVTILLALAGMALLAGCTTVDDQDEGQTRDRPTGGTGR